MFIEALATHKASGALIRMDNSAKQISVKAGGEINDNLLHHYLLDEDVKKAFRYPTTLAAIEESVFDLIVRHGYECTDATLNTYRSDLAGGRINWENRT